eukprot:gnl/Spiro4/15726_TR8462_c0_g2_i2.p1 gnl/Spiro4/15726_TR8462_c0_g2~~gnl/Spiro4/15726_TR8462_c0_g2_i2.p1  ORF type:complete len:178 (-),score=10.25 gnl/Spiro4/15726_TR8462_c0_g2_i2:50-583(-)
MCQIRVVLFFFLMALFFSRSGEPAPITGSRGKFLFWLEDQLRDSRAHPVPLFDDELRNFVDVANLVDVIEIAIERFSRARGRSLNQTPWLCSGRVFNAGGPAALSRMDLARLFCENVLAQPISSTIATAVPRSSVDLGFVSPLDLTMDSSALAQEFGITLTPVQQILRRVFCECNLL